MSQYELKLIDRRHSARDRKIFQRKILSEEYCIWRKARNLRLQIYGPLYLQKGASFGALPFLSFCILSFGIL